MRCPHYRLFNKVMSYKLYARRDLVESKSQMKQLD